MVGKLTKVETYDIVWGKNAKNWWTENVAFASRKKWAGDQCQECLPNSDLVIFPISDNFNPIFVIRLSQSRPGVQYFKEFTTKVFFNIRKLHYMHNLLRNEIRISRRTEVRVNFLQKGILCIFEEKNWNHFQWKRLSWE